MSDSKTNPDRLTCIRLARRNYQIDAMPLISDLRALGFNIDSVGDLYIHNIDYREAIPVLAEWLPKITNPVLKEDVIRALSVKWAKPVTPLLIEQFMQEEDSADTGLRWTIGNALEVLASDKYANDLISIATDSSHGRTREMVVLGLGKLKDPRAAAALIELLDDKDVAGHAVMALGRLRHVAARPKIEGLLLDSRAWVRNEARKALQRIDKKLKG